ncbi:MAG: hypothetical protein LC799_24710 [Actinobacteria bacterium]|nr:hypothetical protein [Actinomycetota bacterium]
MTEHEAPRTRLEQLLRQQHLTVEEFRRKYERVGKGVGLSDRQAYRWIAGQVHSLPHLSAQGILEQMFGEPVTRLFGRPTAPQRCGLPDGTMGWSRRGAARGPTGKDR